MSQMPMHNRFAEGFLEARPSGYAIDPLSSRLVDAAWLDLDARDMHCRARVARDAALSQAIGEAGAALLAGLRIVTRAPLRALQDWWQRERAAEELYALDDRTLADLGLQRSAIPFILASGVDERDPRRADYVETALATGQPANSNDKGRSAA